METTKRNYGIDLLRLVLMFMVCMLHTLGQGGVLRASAEGTAAYYVYWFLEILCYCAVDGFAIISGYMASDKPRKYEKLAEMWFQAFFYSFVLTVLLTGVRLILGREMDMGITAFVKCALPVTFGKFWYFSAFFVLYFAIPVLNRFIFSIEETAAKKMLLILIGLFSVVELLGFPFKTESGYSAIWLIVLYCIGALAKRIRLFEKKNALVLIALWALCILCTFAVQTFAGIGRLTNYVSPTILMSGLILVILFSRLRVNGKWIAKLSPLAFGIYLFQMNTVIWNGILADAFAFVAEKNILTGVLYAFGGALSIFLSGLIVEFCRVKAAKALRIPWLCGKIVKVADWSLTKVSVLLK